MIVPRWQLWCARLFGRKEVSSDDKVSITVYYWRRVWYVWNVEQKT